MKIYQLVTVFIIFILTGCGGGGGSSSSKPEAAPQVPETDTNITEMDKLTIPEGFNFKMTKEVIIDLILESEAGEVLSGVEVEVLTDHPYNNGDVIGRAVTDAFGRYMMAISVPSYQEKLFVRYNYIGLNDGIWLQINNSEVIEISDHAEIETPPIALHFSKIFNTLSSRQLNYLTTHDHLGVPDNLLTPDTISADFLADINASLPEKRPVPDYPSQLYLKCCRNQYHP